MSDSKEVPPLDAASDWTMHRFVVTNPQGNTGDLLREVAAKIDGLGEAEVEDIVFGAYATSDEVHMTVYYSPG